MAKLVLLGALLCASLTQAKSLKLELYAETSLPKKVSLEGEPVGGLSGILWEKNKLYAVSDDRGKYGVPRFYELDLKIKNGKAELTATKSFHIKGTDEKWILDLEAIALLPSGDFLFSTEGNNDAKPRALPHVFVTSAEGKYKSELPLPDKFLPDLVGLQKKGIENNRGFESMTVTPDGQNVYIMNEAPIMADQTAKEDASAWLRLVHFVKEKDKESFKVSEELPYLLDPRTGNDKGVEVFRGLSDFNYLKVHYFFTLLG
jgi:hypothetical protein